jgi:hypothetical protein
MALRNNGGWDAVDAAFDDPPVSMEQIIHPERYLERDHPLEVSVAPVDTVLAASDGWAFVMERTLGEFYLRRHLRTQSLSNREVSRAATGWGGDRFQLYYNDRADELAWVLNLTWDTAQDAAEFAEIYEPFAVERGGDSAEHTLLDDIICVERVEDTLCLQHEDRTTNLALAPDMDTATDMINTQ